MSKKLEVKLFGKTLKNPVMPAAGGFGFGVEQVEEVDVRKLGAVVTKSVTLSERVGNNWPRLVATDCGVLNSIGLQNPGVEEVKQEQLQELARLEVPIIVNITADSIEEYVSLAKQVEGVKNVLAVELNISCPNISFKQQEFGLSPGLAFELVKAVKQEVKKAVVVKLTANFGDVLSFAKRVEEAGADGLTLINSISGLVLDSETGKPILANKTGGLSGPAIKPIALRIVYEVAQVVRIPIIGVGGVRSAQDVVDFISAGASVVGVASAHFENPLVCLEIIEELPKLLESLRVSNVSELRGRSWKE